jgi:hypothetical protein
LATDRFKEACMMMNPLSSSATNGGTNSPFLEEALDYWEMLLAFLTDTESIRDLGQISSVGPIQQIHSAMPHAWNGISREVVRILTATGRLIFRVKKHLPTIRFTHQAGLDFFRDALQEAGRLEQRILAYRPIHPSSIKTQEIPKRHLRISDSWMTPFAMSVCCSSTVSSQIYSPIATGLGTRITFYSRNLRPRYQRDVR